MIKKMDYEVPIVEQILVRVEDAILGSGDPTGESFGSQTGDGESEDGWN